MKMNSDLSSDAPKLPPVTARRGMFFANLNVFFACLILSALFAAGPLLMVASILLAPLAHMQKAYAGFMFPAIYFLLALPLVFFWWKTGLAPATRIPERERRYRMGHWLVGITTIATIAAFAAPFLLAHFSGKTNFVMLGWITWIALPIYAFCYLAWAAGLYMIWSSRA